MGLRRLFKRVKIRIPKFKNLVKIAAPVASIASFTPAGRIARIASGAAKIVKAAAASKKVRAVAGVAGLTGAAAIAAGGSKMLFGKRRKRKSFKGISEREMVELMKLQMFVGKYSMPYQIAVMKAIGGKLK